MTCPRSIMNQMSSMLRFPQLLFRFSVRGMSDCPFRSVVPPSSGEDLLVAFLAWTGVDVDADDRRCSNEDLIKEAPS